MMDINLHTQASNTGLAEQASKGVQKSGGTFKGILGNLMATLQKHDVKADTTLSKEQHVKSAGAGLSVIKKTDAIKDMAGQEFEKTASQSAGLSKTDGVTVVAKHLLGQQKAQGLNAEKIEGDESVVGLGAVLNAEKQVDSNKAIAKGFPQTAQDKPMLKGDTPAAAKHANNTDLGKENTLFNDKLVMAKPGSLEANGAKILAEKHDAAQQSIGKNQLNPAVNVMGQQASGLAAQGVEGSQAKNAGKEALNPDAIKSMVQGAEKNQAKSTDKDGVNHLTKKMTSLMSTGQQGISKADEDAIKQEWVLGETRKVVTAQQSHAKQLSDGATKPGKVQAGFQPVTAQRGGLTQGQSNTVFQAHLAATGQDGQALKAEALIANAVSQAGKAQAPDMQDSEANRGRLGMDGLMMEMRDIRGSRQDLNIPTAYRSAPSFQPHDVMLEIAKSARDGTMKMELQLEPAHLGKIQVTLQTDTAKQLHVHLMVDQNASRQVLEQQLPLLRQALADQGLNLSGFTMDMGSGQQQGESNQAAHASGSTWKLHDDMNISQQSQTTLGMNTATDGGLSMLV